MHLAKASTKTSVDVIRVIKDLIITLDAYIHVPDL